MDTVDHREQPPSPWSPTTLFSSARQTWETPPALFDALDAEFGFVLDAAADTSNHKCDNYLTTHIDGLAVSWCNHMGRKRDGGAVWLNPPYGRAIGKWVEKAYRESLLGCVVVVLTFARTDTRWWHQWAMKAAEVRLIPGRVRFCGASASAPAPSCVLVFDEHRRLPRFTAQELPRR